MAAGKKPGGGKGGQQPGGPPAKKPKQAVAGAPAPQPVVRAGVAGQIEGWYNSAVKYLKAVRSEAKRISWPSRKDLQQLTMVVLFVLVSVTFFLFVCDNLFTLVFRLLVRH